MYLHTVKLQKSSICYAINFLCDNNSIISYVVVSAKFGPDSWKLYQELKKKFENVCCILYVPD